MRREMKEDFQVPRVSTKSSVDKAYTLLKSVKLQGKKLKINSKSKFTLKTPESIEGERRKKIYEMKKDRYVKKLVLDLHAIKRRLPWQEYLIMKEIRNAMSKQNWTTLQRIFPYCGFNTTQFQPIRFTYAFLLSLCNQTSNEIHFENFLQTCISHNIIEAGMLEKLMTLQLRPQLSFT